MTYGALTAQETTFTGHGEETCEGYAAIPHDGAQKAGIVVIPHMPGWDEWSIETTRKFAHHGYNTICPNLYTRNGPGAPDDVAARARAGGGVPDAQVMGDVAAAIA